MGITQFSLRWLFVGVAISGLACLAIAQAIRGQPWAIGVVCAMIVPVVTVAAQATLFGLAWCLGRIPLRRRRAKVG